MSTNNEQLRQAMELLLELPQISVEAAFEDRDGQLIVTLSSTQEGTTCRRCGHWITTRNSCSEWKTLRHLDLLGKPVYLRFRLPRYRCDCDEGPTTTQQVPWFNRRSRMTKAYEEHLLRACINSALSDVAQKEGVSVETLQGLLDRQIATTPDWKHVPSLEVIGIDEIALKKGHRDVVAIVTGQSGAQTHILGVLKDRKKATVVEFLSSIPKRLRRTVRVLCSDLHDGFIGAAKAVFGRHVRVVADRFHVAKLYREALDTLRKKELKRLKRTLSAQQYQRLNGAMWALRKQPEHLSDEEQAVLTRLFHWSPDLKDAVAFRDELTALFKA